jgi:ATP-binding protein involved in chromosome partitioning
VDPRQVAIELRLRPVRRILAVTGGKGGIGKSSVASVLALVLARRGLRTALLDLDLTAPSDHVILGAADRFPTETHGVEPPRVEGVQLMSIAYFLREHAAPLRGADVTNALLEILAITHWDPADVLIIDLPPGLGDLALDAARWLPRAEYLVVGVRSRVVLETLRRMLRLLRDLDLPVAGLLENMARGEHDAVAAEARAFDVPWLGALPFDASLEAAYGDGARLAASPFARALEPIAGALLEREPEARSRVAGRAEREG